MDLNYVLVSVNPSVADTHDFLGMKRMLPIP